MPRLHIQKFIEQDREWEKTLSAPPYSLRVSRDRLFGRNLVMLKYDQTCSDFSIALVREARGLVLDEDTLEPVSYAFDKFMNWGEPLADEIDWGTAAVTQKLDGSIIKAVRTDGGLMLSTNGTIDAFKAELQSQIGCPYRTFGDLALAAARNEMADAGEEGDPAAWLAGKLDEGVTYMFELTSKWNRIVVQWDEPRLHFLGCRDNRTFAETRFEDHPLAKVFHTPAVYPLRSADECLAAAKDLPVSEEGYVVRDARFRRVKIKSPLYVSVHHMRGDDGTMSYRRALSVVRANETAEVLAYFPEYGEAFARIEDGVASLAGEAERLHSDLMTKGYATRKEQAAWINSNCRVPGVAFAMLDGRIGAGADAKFRTASEAFYAMPDDRLLRLLGLKD